MAIVGAKKTAIDLNNRMSSRAAFNLQPASQQMSLDRQKDLASLQLFLQLAQPYRANNPDIDQKCKAVEKLQFALESNEPLKEQVIGDVEKIHHFVDAVKERIGRELTPALDNQEQERQQQEQRQVQVLSMEAKATDTVTTCALICAIPAEMMEQFKEKWDNAPQKGKARLDELPRDTLDADLKDANLKLVQLEFRDESAESLSSNVVDIIQNTLGAEFDPELQDLFSELVEAKIAKRLEKEKAEALEDQQEGYDALNYGM